MKLGVFTCLLQNLPLEEALKYFKSLGIEMIELGCGGFPGNAHCDPETLLNDEEKFNEFVATIKKYDMEIYWYHSMKSSEKQNNRNRTLL